MIDNNTWYDVVLEIDNQIPSVRFFVKKSDGGEYELVKADAPYQNYIPSKLVMGFDSGAGSIVFDNFKFYGSNAADNDTEALLDYEMALATGLYDINNIIASPTLTRGTDNYVDVTDYVKSQINDPDVWKNEDGTIDVAFKLSHCTGKAIIIEGASSALVAERSFAESNVAVRTLDENGTEFDNYSTMFMGYPQTIKPDGCYGACQRHGLYRWHIADPVFLTALVISLCMPAVLFFFGSPSVTECIGGYFGFILLWSSFIAAGLFISSLTESQTAAAVFTFAALMFINYIDYIASGVSNETLKSIISAFTNFRSRQRRL